jgi:hypothetical protein
MDRQNVQTGRLAIKRPYLLKLYQLAGEIT